MPIVAAASALSGLQAASRALQGHAHNLAHSGATSRRDDGGEPPFRLFDTYQVTAEGGGVRTVQQERDPSSVPLYQPGSPYADADGLVALANVDPVAEIAGTIQARFQFAANLRTLSVIEDISGALLDRKV